MNLFNESRSAIGSRPTLNLDGVNLSAAVPSPYIRLDEVNVCRVEFMVANSPTSGEYISSEPMGVEDISAFIQGYINDPEGTLTSLGWKWKGTLPVAVADKTETIRANINLKDFFKKREGAGL